MKSLFLSVCLFGLLSVTGNGQTTIPPQCWKVENSPSAICKQDGKFYLNPYVHCGEKTCWTGDKDSGGGAPISALRKRLDNKPAYGGEEDQQQYTVVTSGVICEGCSSYGHGIPIEGQKPEPMDVPAIRGNADVIILADGPAKIQVCDRGECRDHLPPQKQVWTCSDKSRILLTDESGGKHCVKFEANIPLGTQPDRMPQLFPRD